MLNKSTKDEQEFAGRIKGEKAASSSSDGSESLGSCTHQTGGLRALDLMSSFYISTHFLCLLSLLGKENLKNTDTQPYSPFVGQTQAGLGSDSISRRLNLLLRLSQVGSHSVLILRPSTVHGNSVLLVWVLPASLACQPPEELIKGCCLLPLPTII